MSEVVYTRSGLAEQSVPVAFPGCIFSASVKFLLTAARYYIYIYKESAVYGERETAREYTCLCTCMYVCMYVCMYAERERDGEKCCDSLLYTSLSENAAHALTFQTR